MTTHKLLENIRAAAQPRTQAAVDAARAAGIPWREIAGALRMSHAGAWRAYGPRHYITRRAVLPGLSVEDTARNLGISSPTLYKRIRDLPSGHPAVVKVPVGARVVTRVLDADVLSQETR